MFLLHSEIFYTFEKITYPSKNLFSSPLTEPKTILSEIIMALDNEYKQRIQELESRIKSLEMELLSHSGKADESRLRRAEIASRSGNWEYHLETGKMHGSEGALMLYGLKNAELDYEVVKSIPLPEFRPLLDAALRELLTADKPYNIEFKIRNAETGNIIDIDSTAEFDKKKKTVFGIIRDITQQKASEEQIRRKSQELSVLLEITLDLLEKADRKAILNKILVGANRLIGLETAAIYSVIDDYLIIESTIPPLPDNFPEEFRKAFLINHPHVAKALKVGTPLIIPDIKAVELTTEENIIVSQRDMRTLLYIPLIASGQSYGIIILGTLGRLHHFDEHEIDVCRTISNIASLALENSILITNLKSARDKAEESDKLKTAFLHNISHEIRTPLNAIIGFSGFLDQSDLEESERRKYIEIIQQSNNQLLNIINDIFNVSHIEAGQVLLKEDMTDICSVLNNLYVQFLPQSEKKGLELKLELNNFPEKVCKVITDEGKLIQVLSNFLNNAIKFTATGSVILGCSREDDGLMFYVKDTGIGISESEQSKVFERFYQVEKSISRIYSGAGLGLSISDAYVRLLGGEIKLESAPGKGTCFSFKIRCNLPPSNVEHPQIKKEDYKRGNELKKTILIAEDEISNFLLLELMLKSTNARILHAANGLEAINICRSDEKIDLVLMDIKMPVMDGFKAASEIKKIRPDLTIVAQTAYTDINDRQKILGSGCSDFIAKPITKLGLFSVLGKYLS